MLLQWPSHPGGLTSRLSDLLAKVRTVLLLPRIHLLGPSQCGGFNPHLLLRPNHRTICPCTICPCAHLLLT